MTETLTIDRVVVNSPDDGHGLADRVGRIVRHVANTRLERTLGSNTLAGEGDWCIPQVTLSAVLDLERPDLSLEEALAQAVLDAIADALPGQDVVRYPRPVDALADLIASASLGRFEHAWAWEWVGIIADAADVQRRPGTTVLDALALHASDVIAALTRAVSAVGLAALHRMFSVDGWVRLADIVIGAHVGVARRSDVMAMMRDSAAVLADAVGDADILRASRLVGSSRLAAAARASRLRLDGQTSRALAVLVVAESEPAVLPAKGVGAACLAVAQIVAGTREPATERRAASIDSKASAEAAENAETALSRPAGETTSHAGLLFLLNAASDAEMPGTLMDDPELNGIQPSELLARLALALIDTADDDPAVHAFAGLDQERARSGWSRQPLPPNVSRGINEHARAWAAASAARLGREDEDPALVAAEMACRSGRIERQQGWMDVHLDLADVDIDVRRAGLDLDPGWVSWLGSVVRFVYE